MSATLSKQEKCPRQIAENTLQSLNCKTDKNLNEYIVLIVGINDNCYLFEKLLTMISRDRVQSFNDINIETSLAYIGSRNSTNIFLIISGTLGENYANKFIIKQNLVGLYVYCMDVEKHTLWTKGLTKIRCVVSNLKQLLTRLHSDIKQFSERWPFEEKSFQKALTSTSQ